MIPTNLDIWIMAIFLIIISVIDIKTYNKKHDGIPSYLTTLFIMLAVFFHLINGTINYLPVVGMVAYLIGLFLIDTSYFEGLADLKIFIGICLLVGSLEGLGIFTIVMLVVGLCYKFIYKRTTKANTCPFIPSMFISYLILVGLKFLGGLI